MNIALVSREYPPFFGGGIGTYTDQFSRALARAGHRVVVVTVSDDGKPGRGERDGVVVVRLPFLRGGDWSGPHESIATPEARAAFTQFAPVSVFAMEVARALPGLVEEFDLDVIEAPDTGALAWFALNQRKLGRPCGRRGWPPLVIHLHSPTAWIERWDRAPQAGRAHVELKRMERDVVRWADGLVCPSHALAEWAEGFFGLDLGAADVIRLPLGDLEHTRAREAAASGPRRVLYAGRLEPRKGVDVLLAGFVRAVEGGADLRLGLAGRDSFDVRTGGFFGAGCLERLVPPAARSLITLHGPLEPEPLADLRRGAHFAAAPAPNDNFPYSCMEAMAAGLPVVAARAGGMAEMVTGNGDGLLFEPGDVEGCAIALSLAAAMSADQIAAMGRAARERIVALCGTGAVVGERIAHYQRVIGRRQAAAGGEDPGDIVVIGGDETGAALLIEAVKAGAAFAHGWTRDGSDVRAFGTPTLEGLTAGPREVGPVAVPASTLDRLGLEVDWRNPWELTTALAQAGEEGMVVPDCMTEVPSAPDGGCWPPATGQTAVRLCMELGPAIVAALEARRKQPAGAAMAAGNNWQARAENAESTLATMTRSRGWRLLTRVYAVLHVLKGRGRPAGPRAGGPA